MSSVVLGWEPGAEPGITWSRHEVHEDIVSVLSSPVYDCAISVEGSLLAVELAISHFSFASASVGPPVNSEAMLLVILEPALVGVTPGVLNDTFATGNSITGHFTNVLMLLVDGNLA